MSLIRCPECHKEVSDKAVSCVNCGFPLQNNEPIDQSSNMLCPNLNCDLNIGEVIVTPDNCVAIEYQSSLTKNEILNSGKYYLYLNKNGISVTSLSPDDIILPIHYKQLEKIELVTSEQLKNKSVIGRAALGGIIFGPLGAIVGGMSGIGQKPIKSKYYIILNFWDINSRILKTISFGANSFLFSSVPRFIKNVELGKKKI